MIEEAGGSRYIYPWPRALELWVMASGNRKVALRETMGLWEMSKGQEILRGISRKARRSCES